MEERECERNPRQTQRINHSCGWGKLEVQEKSALVTPRNFDRKKLACICYNDLQFIVNRGLNLAQHRHQNDVSIDDESFGMMTLHPFIHLFGQLIDLTALPSDPCGPTTSSYLTKNICSFFSVSRYDQPILSDKDNV